MNAQAEANTKIKSAERDRDALIKEKESWVQFLSLALPPIPLLIVALVVFIKKKTAEIQGAIASRVRA